jgi:hypothetical protein
MIRVHHHVAKRLVTEINLAKSAYWRVAQRTSELQQDLENYLKSRQDVKDPHDIKRRLVEIISESDRVINSLKQVSYSLRQEPSAADDSLGSPALSAGRDVAVATTILAIGLVACGWVHAQVEQLPLPP